jgi:glycosyltransferase involved in cell wall biosynthesis
MNHPALISVVIPILNEEESLELLYQKLRVACDQLGSPYELIFVDDGSEDRSFFILQKLRTQDNRLKVIRFRKNYGQTAAMTAGFDYAKGQIIVSMDGDLQNDPADILKLVTKMEEGFDVVSGWRENRKDKYWTRRFPSRIANWIISRLTGVRLHDSGCSLKAYHGSVIKSLSLYGEMHRFIPALTRVVGARVGEVSIQHHARQYGKSKYGIGRIWRVALDIIVVKMITDFSSRPLRWFGLLSIPGFILGFGFLFLALAMYSNNRVDSMLVPSIVSFLSLFLSGHLLTMGIVGELSIQTSDFIGKRLFLPLGKYL